MKTSLWKETRLSDDLTHHLIMGKPLYKKRFTRVQKYHNPGIAPVLDKSGAYHIDMTGEPIYGQRHRTTYGFYCNRAAVSADNGWFHVDIKGKPVYQSRYDWCGNYQEDISTVRTFEHRYFHVDLKGSRLYPESYCYAGDFKDGMAVIQRNDGKYSHLDIQGHLIHNNWYHDLDVYHKGFARARDKNGWFHLGIDGKPVYGQRYEMIEPFYNGQARVGRYDGTLESISDNGKHVCEIRKSFRSDFLSLSEDMVGFWKTWTIYAAIQLHLPEYLPGSLEDVSRRCDLSEQSLLRLLNGLGELSIVDCVAGIWQLTNKGLYLQASHDKTLANAAREYALYFNPKWSRLVEVLKGKFSPEDPFDLISKDSDRVKGFHKMLNSYAVNDYENIVDQIDISSCKTVIDAGGGQGFLSKLLSQLNPDVHFFLLDRPEVLAIDKDSLRQFDNLEAVAGDLFAPWNISSDCVIMARVLHDWYDDRCLQLLRNARSALSKDGKLIIIEMCREPDDFNGSLCDLHLLVNTEGAERTLLEYQVLFHETGFRLNNVIDTEEIVSIIVAGVQ
jgi:hypothetical protein